MDPLDPNDPEQIGGYRLTHVLGEGGMGRVYLGRTQGGRKVVVKVIRAEYVRNPEYRARFVREVEAARQVGGFHTAQVVEADIEAPEPWIVSDYVPGPSLGHLVESDGPVAMPSLKVLAAGLAEGLAAIHRHGLIHRDLKPGNILMADNGPRIIDFGITRPDGGTRITHPGRILGTPAYMAPEQATGDTDRLGPAVDVFALGTVLHFAATGTNPFKADNMMASLGRLLSTRPRVPEGVPEPVRGVITGCWQREPEQRPTPEKILALLGEIAPESAWPPVRGRAGRPPPTLQEPTRPQPIPPVRKPRLWESEAKRRRQEWERNHAEAGDEVARQRVMVRRNPRVHRPSLAHALGRQAAYLNLLDRREEYLVVKREEVALRARITREEPFDSEPAFSQASRDLAAALADVNRYAEALGVITQAVDLYRNPSSHAPPRPEPALAHALHLQTCYLKRLGRTREALSVAFESVDLHRKLFQRRPLLYRRSLGIALRAQVSLLEECGRRADARRIRYEWPDLT